MGKRQREQFERRFWVGQHTRFHMSPHSVPRSTSLAAQHILILLTALCDLEHDNTFILFQGAATVTRSQRERRKARRERKDKFINQGCFSEKTTSGISQSREMQGRHVALSWGRDYTYFSLHLFWFGLSCHVNMLNVLPSLASAPCVLISV